MNSLQISNILRKNKITKKCFKGVFSSNNIPVFTNYPHCFVANTDRVGYNGTHWVAIFVPNNYNVEYFDSFGSRPNSDLFKYLSRYKNFITHNYKIQSPFADTCGFYCIYFLFNRTLGIGFEKIVKFLKTRANVDLFVKSFVRNKLLPH